MTTIAQCDSTVNAIRNKVRRLTASPGVSALSNNDLDQYINTFYNQDFPYAIKIDQLRDVYSFYTQPYVDTYPLDVNFNQGIREPVYVDGIRGFLFKDRWQFYNMWTRFPTSFKPISGDGVTQTFSFTIPGPFLANEVTLGGLAVAGNAITVSDDGNGNLLLRVPNPRVQVPPYPNPSTPPWITTPNPIPGMPNQNTNNPGDYALTNIGSVNYVTGQFAITFPTGYIPAAGTQINLYVVQYATGRPYSVLFWNNTFTIRPVPKLVHKIEVETFLTPVQFMTITDTPILNQWWQYIAYGVAREVMRDRNDFNAVQMLQEGFDRQEGLVLERQAIEQIGQRNTTIFSSALPAQGWNNAWGYYF